MAMMDDNMFMGTGYDSDDHDMAGTEAHQHQHQHHQATMPPPPPLSSHRKYSSNSAAAQVDSMQVSPPSPPRSARRRRLRSPARSSSGAGSSPYFRGALSPAAARSPFRHPRVRHFPDLSDGTTAPPALSGALSGAATAVVPHATPSRKVSSARAFGAHSSNNHHHHHHHHHLKSATVGNSPARNLFGGLAASSSSTAAGAGAGAGAGSGMLTMAAAAAANDCSEDIGMGGVGGSRKRDDASLLSTCEDSFLSGSPKRRRRPRVSLGRVSSIESVGSAASPATAFSDPLSGVNMTHDTISSHGTLTPSAAPNTTGGSRSTSCSSTNTGASIHSTSSSAASAGRDRRAPPALHNLATWGSIDSSLDVTATSTPSSRKGNSGSGGAARSSSSTGGGGSGVLGSMALSNVAHMLNTSVHSPSSDDSSLGSPTSAHSPASPSRSMNCTPPPPPHSPATPRTPTSIISTLPLPDQSAFMSDETHYRPRHTPEHNQTPPCPPTPARVPVWKAPTLVRVTSLAQAKIIAGGTQERGQPFNFNKEFVDLGSLGMGSFYQVTKVRQRSDGKLYAMKRTLRQCRSKKEREQLVEEFLVAQHVPANPNVIKYYKTMQQEGFVYHQLELCTRGSLRDLLEHMDEEEHLREDAIWYVLKDLANGLAAIHSAGVVHLDLKPENAFISEDGTLKIGDFGMAHSTHHKLRSASSSSSSASASDASGAGASGVSAASAAASATSAATFGGSDDGFESDDDGVEGDNRYMAPELLRRGGKTTAADIFSLGAAIFELVWDVLLPSGGDDWHHLRDDRIPSLPAWTARYPRSSRLIEATRAMLSSDPSKRPTAEQILGLSEIKAAAQRPSPFLGATGPQPRARPAAPSWGDMSSLALPDLDLDDAIGASTTGAPHSAGLLSGDSQDGGGFAPSTTAAAAAQSSSSASASASGPMVTPTAAALNLAGPRSQTPMEPVPEQHEARATPIMTPTPFATAGAAGGAGGGAGVTAATPAASTPMASTARGFGTGLGLGTSLGLQSLDASTATAASTPSLSLSRSRTIQAGSLSESGDSDSYHVPLSRAPLRRSSSASLPRPSSAAAGSAAGSAAPARPGLPPRSDSRNCGLVIDLQEQVAPSSVFTSKRKRTMSPRCCTPTDAPIKYTWYR